MMITSNNEAETMAFARQCAAKATNGTIYTLQGPLGAGKSLFCRAFIQNLMGAEIDVPSPTFTLVQTYDAPIGQIWHFDLFRLEYPEEIYEIGWEEALSDGILLIEWPERLGNLLPKNHQEIIIKPISAESRHIEYIQQGQKNG